MLKVLRSDHPVRASTANVLCGVHSRADEIQAALVEALENDTDETVRREAAFAIRWMPNAMDALPTMLAALDDTAVVVREVGHYFTVIQRMLRAKRYIQERAS